jgi:hypothetical protein
MKKLVLLTLVMIMLLSTSVSQVSASTSAKNLNFLYCDIVEPWQTGKMEYYNGVPLKPRLWMSNIPAGIHYMQFRIVKNYFPATLMLKITPMWREPNGKGWQSWGPYYVANGGQIQSLRLRTGENVQYQFIVERAPGMSLPKTFEFQYRRLISCNR